jgi:hypothetical protein
MADVVWPALYLETRVLAWWTIALGLLVEFLIVRPLFALPYKKAVVVTLAANAVSTVAGILLIPLAGLVWEIFPGLLYMKIPGWSTFNPITWTASFVFACLINTVIEALVYNRGFKLVVRRRQWFWLFVANAASVGMAMGSLFVSGVEP